jgi:hypothetical protein
MSSKIDLLNLKLNQKMVLREIWSGFYLEEGISYKKFERICLIVLKLGKKRIRN